MSYDKPVLNYLGRLDDGYLNIFLPKFSNFPFILHPGETLTQYLNTITTGDII